jgi:hypothetical protein
VPGLYNCFTIGYNRNEPGCFAKARYHPWLRTLRLPPLDSPLAPMLRRWLAKDRHTSCRQAIVFATIAAPILPSLLSDKSVATTMPLLEYAMVRAVPLAKRDTSDRGALLHQQSGEWSRPAVSITVLCLPAHILQHPPQIPKAQNPHYLPPPFAP